MVKTSTPRLPGVYFLPPTRAAAPELPLLDVAAFVGFAERGPLDTPVAIKSLDDYHAIFGGDLALARERGGRITYANLPTSVASFFANGGQRCYVVRVAGKESTATRFRVPGMISLGQPGSERHATIQASSVGRWSERLRLATCLRITPMPTDAFRLLASGQLEWQTGSAPQAIQAGDLLRLSLVDEAKDTTTQWLFPVAEVRHEPNAASVIPVTLVAKYTWQIKTEIAPSQPIEETGRLTPNGVESLNVSSQISNKDDGLFLELTGGDVDRIQQGDVLRLQISDTCSYLFPIAKLRRESDAGSSSIHKVVATGEMMLCLPAQPISTPSLLSIKQVERLRFDLLLWEEERKFLTLRELSSNAGHPRFWGEVALLESSPRYRQPSIDTTGIRAAQAVQLYREMQRDERSEWLQQMVQRGLVDTVALAGLLAPLPEGETECAHLPLGMPPIITKDTPIGPDASDVGKDDLEEFDTDLFLDSDLMSNQTRGVNSGDALMAEAFHKHYERGERLQGLHSLLFLDDVAMVSLPDAPHCGWPGNEDEPPAPSPPKIEPPPAGPGSDEFSDCCQPVTLSSVNPDEGPVSEPTTVVLTGSGFTDNEDTRVTFGEKEATNVHVHGATVIECKTPVVTLPGPVKVTVQSRDISACKANAFVYRLVRHEPGLPKPKEPNEFDSAPLLQAHKALVHFCQARRDVLGILTLPVHFEKRQCIKWLETLRTELGLPRHRIASSNARDIADLSYVAVYHPWLLIEDVGAPDTLRAVPSDGAACGVIAARARERQVWVAPANVPLQGVQALAPSFSKDDWADLFDLQFNLIRREAHDFRAMNAHTLSDEWTLLPVSVRRLMIMLRKVAAQRGMDFVFENNVERFHDGVRLALEEMLQSLFERGAFAGERPRQAFRVLTDTGLNTPQSIESGRFNVQIQVAPSQPAEFMTVLLTRVSEGHLQATEV